MFSFAGAWAGELEIINLKHRSADELMPVIRPLLGADEVVSGMNYQLILRASRNNIEQIRRLVENLDTALRRLQITVMQDVDSETAASLTELSGSVKMGKNASIGTSTVNPGQVSAKIISTRSLENDKKTQQVQVLEGHRALISSGKSLPQRQVVQSGWGTQVIDNMSYRNVSSGFYVLPRITGDRVTLEITAQNDALTPGSAIRVQNATTTVSGYLGVWIQLGGINQQSSNDGSTITSRSHSTLDEQRSVLLKVEEIN